MKLDSDILCRADQKALAFIAFNERASMGRPVTTKATMLYSPECNLNRIERHGFVYWDAVGWRASSNKKEG